MTSTPCGKFISPLHPKRLLPVLVGLVCATTAWAQDADILMLVGPGEVRTSEPSAWTPARVTQKLGSGSFVRTGPDGQMALLLRDQTQLRLNQNTTLQIRSLQAGSDSTVLSLTQGRLWAQVKQLATGAFRVTAAAVLPNRLRIITPTATVGIRGTDWELVVGDQGITTLTVVSGEVEMSNEFGRVSVGANEQAVAEAGKAPVKSLLSSARDRVQWVTAYRPSPARWVPNPPAALQAAVRDIEAGAYTKAVAALEPNRSQLAASLLLADVYIYQGRTDDAIKTLAPLSQAGRGNPVATALQGRALLIAGRLDEAASLLQEGLKTHPADRELVLAAADVARVQGDADQALRWFAQVTLAHPKSHEAWFGVGRIQVDKEDVPKAKTALDEALRLSPNEAGYLGERATLLALSGDLTAARLAFDEALKQQPDDYLAWTGLGILQLKTGEPQQALESFLKATVLEPRFARAQLYAGVAYYQLDQIGGAQRAIEAVNRAAQLDAKDPLPYLMLGLIYGDAQELALATEAAQQAQVRMPFLKSANQLLNDQKGSANVGTALANRGMEEWAQSFASETYNPYWAGSAFFAADRYSDGFNKNSQLYRGFLLDPLSFGASNRFSSLVAVPGHYGSVGVERQRADIDYSVGQVTANGLFATHVPVAYSLTGQRASLSTRNGQLRDSNFDNLTVGLGIKPSSDLGIFYFGSRIGLAGKTPSATAAGLNLPDSSINLSNPRHDIGLTYRFAPDNQIMLKYGQGTQSTSSMGKIEDKALANFFDTLIVLVEPDAVPFNPIAIRDYRARNRNRDIQFSHSLALNSKTQLTWGYERAQDQQSAELVESFQGAPAAPRTTRFELRGTRDLKYTGWYVSSRSHPSDTFSWQADLAHQSFSGKSVVGAVIDAGGGIDATEQDVVTPESIRSLSPRLGLRIATAQGQQLKLVYQRWRRPTGVATLAPVDTLGIPVEDRLVTAGGLLTKLRAQYDWQRNDTSFYRFFADQRQVSNLQNRLAAINGSLELLTLESVRPRGAVFGQAFDELEETPQFGKGKVSSMGMAGNWLLASDVSVSARYHYATSQNTGADFLGLKVPYIPRHLANALVYWQPTNRWQLIARATYRSSRFTDEANLLRLAAGWNYGVAANWESSDKRLNVQAALLNIRANKQASADLRTLLSLTGIYRF